VIVLHDTGGGVDFGDAVTIAAADYDAVAFIAAPGPIPDWRYEGREASPTLNVTDITTRVYLDGIRLLNETDAIDGQSLRCDDARVDIRRSRIVENLGGGIVALGQCELVVQNSFIGVNPNDNAADGVDAVLIADAEVTASILYSTLGAGPGEGASALSCAAAATVEVRNSLLVSLSATPEVECPDAVLTTNASEAGGLGDMSESWFANYDAGNFHVNLPLLDGFVADWQLGDPTTDIDGESRVIAEGCLGHAGADVIWIDVPLRCAP
jgi:hypothetical protein